MPTTPDLFDDLLPPAPPSPPAAEIIEDEDGDDSILLHESASRDYLEYAIAVVKGRVTRSKGRTNKEMLVRLSSAAGTRVLRTDFTDSKGYFYVAGLDDGNYTISVNSDSWRGISRRFTGKHSITVKAGRVYSVGTLKFYG